MLHAKSIHSEVFAAFTAHAMHCTTPLNCAVKASNQSAGPPLV